MKVQKDIWSYVIITVLSVLIWFWAASETRVQRDVRVTVQFSVDEPAEWIITPDRTTVKVTAEGSHRAIQNAEAVLGQMSLPIDPTIGQHSVEVAERLRNHPDIRASGIAVVTTDPIAHPITIDRVVHEEARVVVNDRRSLEDIEIRPPQVDVVMPSSVRSEYLLKDLTVEAMINESELQSLQRGVRQTLMVRVAMPDGGPAAESVEIIPQLVELSFTMRSQVTEYALSQPVQVRSAESPEVDEFAIAMEPKQLQDVTISGSKEVIEEIRKGETVVVAIVHLTFSEKESRISSKRVSCFLALRPDGSAEMVEARVGPAGEERPVINLNITERAAGG